MELSASGLLSEFDISEDPLEQEGGAVRSTADFDIRIPYIADVVDAEAEKERA